MRVANNSASVLPKSSAKNKSKTLKSSKKEITDTQPIEDKITEILLADDANLLAVICQASFVGDTAASVSLGVLSLLRKRGPKITEEFLKRLFRSRIEEYISKSRDLSDIVRDNSMATMLLNAFARSEGTQYLIKSLQASINNVLPSTTSCELDPFKLGAPRNINYGSTRFSNLVIGSYIPSGSFFVSEIEASSPASPSASQEEEISKILDQIKKNEDCLKSCCSILISSIINNKEGMPDSIRRMCTFLNATIEDILQEAKQIDNGEDAEAIETSLGEKSDILSDSQSPTFDKGRRRSSHAIHQTIKESQEFQDIIEEENDKESVDLAFDASKRNLLQSQSIETNGLNTGNSTNSSDIQILKPKTHRKRYRSGIKWSRLSQTSVSSVVRKSGGALSVSEKVVGSFLFLRFFVPAITTPDTYGLVTTRVTPSSRRGLILCGKVLTAICNDIDFGHKEQYLQGLNGYLHQNRTLVRQFINFVSSSAMEEPEDDRDTFMSRVNAETLARKNIDVDIDNFFFYIGRSLGKIEAEINHQITTIPEEEGESIFKNFNNLKALLEGSQFTNPSSSPFNSGDDSSEELSSKSTKSGSNERKSWIVRLFIKIGIIKGSN